MSFKSIIIIIVVIALFIGGYFILFSDKQTKTPSSNNGQVNNADSIYSDYDVPVTIRDMSQVPVEYFSGNSRFSYGDCRKDADCSTGGCSGELCTSEKDLVTTCEELNNAPDIETYSCGCIVDTCGWYLKK